MRTQLYDQFGMRRTDEIMRECQMRGPVAHVSGPIATWNEARQWQVKDARVIFHRG
jgi:hypothetical protein